MYRTLRALGKSVPPLVSTIRAARRVNQEVVLGVTKLSPVRRRTIQRYLQRHSTRKLHLGAGGNIHEGWLNTDIERTSAGVVYLDATQPFPLPGKQFDYVYSEHVIEHVPYLAGVHMLSECFRVLKPGGQIRLATPNLAVLLELYTDPKSEIQKRYIQWAVNTWIPEIGIYEPCFVINNAFRNWGHQFLYDQPTLEAVLWNVGFEEVRRYAMGESDDLTFENLERHGIAVGNEEMTAYETLVVEARRPG